MLFDLKGINPKFSAFTPKAGIDWQITDDILAYGSWSKGYKSGGFISGRPVSVSQATGVFQPEKVTAYEAGLKADVFDKRLRINMAYFSNDYNNLQLSYLQNGQYNVATADAKISGFELEATTRPIEGLTLSATLGTLDAKYVNIPINPATGLSYVAGLTLENKLKHSPASEYRLAATYEIPLANRGVLEFNTNYTWADTIYHSVTNNASITSPPYGVLDAQIAYITPNEKWRIALGGKNITDELYWVQGVATFSRFYADPAEFYLNVRYRY
jgi:iron complex outermembrane receptor protein